MVRVPWVDCNAADGKPEPHTAPVKMLFDAQLAISTSSESTMALAGKWLKECLVDHGSCGNERMSAVGPRTLPKRLVDVGQTEDPISARLITTGSLDHETPYLTLSHSWGDGKFLKLTTTNIKDLKSLIPLHELSQTHRDSLSITRRLGYRYIWIDSLCIIQDAVEDWRAHSVLMAAIYGNSTCNIAAKGPSSHFGCFVRRNPLVSRPCQLRQVGEEDSTHGIYAHPYHTATYNAYPLHYYSNDVPLLERAWVQQERILSPRLLYFGGPEIHWECCTTQASESWPSGPPSTDHGFDEVSPLKMAFESELKRFKDWSEDDFFGFVYELWHNGIIRDYTAAKLSFEKDRMAALAGIASVIQSRTDMTYIAGLWKEFLPQDILWYKMDEASPGQNHNSSLRQWTAPTWSWASVEGRVRYTLSAFRHPTDEKIEYLSRVLSCSMTPLDVENPVLGETSQASLTIIGPLVPMVEKAEHLGKQGMGLISKIERRFRPDVDIPESEDLFYLLIIRTKDNDKVRTNTGLVLARRDSEKGGGYIRVGMFVSSYEVEDGCMFGGLDEMTVTIY
jgi:hypothetical protein